MVDPIFTEKQWVEVLVANEVRLRCHYIRHRKAIVKSTVQLEMWGKGNWQPIVRYDNAHGICHRDTIHPDGSQDKTPVFGGDLNTTFTFAIQDLKNNWKAFYAWFREEFLS
jgi:hypothetical protein